MHFVLVQLRKFKYWPHLYFDGCLNSSTYCLLESLGLLYNALIISGFQQECLFSLFDYLFQDVEFHETPGEVIFPCYVHLLIAQINDLFYQSLILYGSFANNNELLFQFLVRFDGLRLEDLLRLENVKCGFGGVNELVGFHVFCK